MAKVTPLTGNEKIFFHGNFRISKAERGWGILNVITKIWYIKPIFNSIDFHDNYVEFRMDDKVALYPLLNIQKLDVELYEKWNESYYKCVMNSHKKQLANCRDMTINGQLHCKMYDIYKELFEFIKRNVSYYGAIVRSNWTSDIIGDSSVALKEGDIITFPFSMENSVFLVPQYKFPLNGEVKYTQLMPVYFSTRTLSEAPKTEIRLIDPLQLLKHFIDEDYNDIHSGGDLYSILENSENPENFLKNVIMQHKQILVCNRKKYKTIYLGREKSFSVYDLNFI